MYLVSWCLTKFKGRQINFCDFEHLLLSFVYRGHHKKRKERKVREKKYSSSQSADEESDKERDYPGCLL